MGTNAKREPGVETVTGTEAATILGVSKQRLCKLLRDGRIPAKREGHAWIVKRADVEAFHALPSGRPRSV